MTAEQAVRELIDRVWNGGHTDELERSYADPFDHGGRPDTVAGLRQWHAAEAVTWADTRYEVTSLVSDGEQVAVRWRATARQVGAWGPVPPTGKTITWDGVHFFAVRDGRVIAMWAMADVFAKALQLGVTMTPPEA
ncbi:ester cyclase [Catellatospora sichuanensis]|uniref:ester cyclase n=1 Tax=Catellatospora sichuanensis TaxID=1969805 RepID=UPI001182A5E8|nr:ester cyclase [Catellatospora sichuanensis]